MEGSFKAWLLRIVTNACYDFLRARKRRPAQSLDDMLEAGTDREPLEFVNGREGPEAHAERAELNRTLQAGLKPPAGGSACRGGIGRHSGFVL